MRSYSIMVWSRATLATMLAAMIDAHVRSPLTTAICGSGASGTSDASTSRYSAATWRPATATAVASLDETEPVDLRVVDRAHRYGERAATDDPVQALALFGCEQLGVVEAWDPSPDREEHGAADARPGERPHADLVDTCHHRVAHGPRHALVPPEHRTTHTRRLPTKDIRHQPTLTRDHAPLPTPPPFGGRESYSSASSSPFSFASDSASGPRVSCRRSRMRASLPTLPRR